MAEETQTTSDNISEPAQAVPEQVRQAAGPTEPRQQEGSTANEQSAVAPPSAKTPAPGRVPSPAALAKKPSHIPAAPSPASYSQADIDAAAAFGRVDDQGNVYNTEDGRDRQVGQFPDAKDPKEALQLYARRYLDLREKLELFATRLKAANINGREIDESLRSLTKEIHEPAAVGDIAALSTRLEALKQEGQEKKEQLRQDRQAALAQALSERTAIVEKAEALLADLNDHTDWRQKADKFRSLFDQWQHHQQTTIRLDKKDADNLWKRFSTARSSFNQARRTWTEQVQAHRSQAKEIKEHIIAQAEELQNSTDWGQTSRLFNQLMDQWKSAGRAGHNEDDALWARFRQAADVFYKARQADRDQTSSNEQDNLQKKEALLLKAEALVPVKDEAAAKRARQALASIQDEWDQIGYVPRSDVHRIESRLDAVDQQITAVEEAAWKQSDPEADARKSSFEQQLEAQLAELDRQIAEESDPDKKQTLQAEKATKEQWLKAIN